MHNMIQQIVDEKRKDLLEEKKNKVYSSSEDPELAEGDESRSKTFRSSRLISFARTITVAAKEKGVAIIAEVKFASPTNPNLGSSEQLLERVKEYEKSGADAISIITEKHYFRGRVKFVTETKEITKLPILQKDFVIDEYQIYQAKQIGSDAILLIARLVDRETLKEFVNLALEIGVEPVVEVNDEEDLKKATATDTNIIAINARDLDTFEVSIEKACELLKKIPERYIKLGFSGIQSKAQVDKYIEFGADGVLVGTALMKTKNIYNFVMSLRREDTSKVGSDSFEVRV